MRTFLTGRDFTGWLTGSLEIRTAYQGLPGATLSRSYIVITAGGKDGQRLVVNGDQIIDAETDTARPSASDLSPQSSPIQKEISQS